MTTLLSFIARHKHSVSIFIFTLSFFCLLASGALEDRLIAYFVAWFYFFALVTPIFAIALGFKRKK